MFTCGVIRSYNSCAKVTHLPRPFDEHHDSCSTPRCQESKSLRAAASVAPGICLLFFAPRAVRPNSPVTIEQKKDHSPFQANHNDRSRSGRPHSPQPGMQSSSRQETKSEANNETHKKTPEMVNIVACRNCTKIKSNLKAAHSDSRVLTQQPIEISKKVPAHREKAKIPISVVKQ